MPGPVDPSRNFRGTSRTPHRRTTWLWLALAVAVVIIAVLSTVVIVQRTAKDSGTSAPRVGVLDHRSAATADRGATTRRRYGRLVDDV